MGGKKYSISDWPSWLLLKKNKWLRRKTHHFLCQETPKSGGRQNTSFTASPRPTATQTSGRASSPLPNRTAKRNTTSRQTCFFSGWFSTISRWDVELFHQSIT